MRIGLFGHGKMGKMVQRLAEQKGDTIVECAEADVCIDFSHASVVLKHLKWALAHHKPLIIGTTAWEDEESEAHVLAANHEGAVLAAPNFSVGVAIFTRLLKEARALLKDYEIAGVEYHHSQKVDAPSGTAKALASTLKTPAPFASVRCGRIPGKYEVIFDSPYDSITFTHEAHNRESYAAGALTAAHWIQGKKGWFTLDDMLRNLYSADHSL